MAFEGVNILVLGATGMLGHAMLRSLSKRPGAQVTGTIRKEAARGLFPSDSSSNLMVIEDLEAPDHLARLIEAVRPDIVVNCVSVGRPAPADPMRSIAIYSVMPQRLSLLCKRAGARLVQISSDGVFSGARGAYTEDDLPDAGDVYGISKLLGEVDAPHAVTLRTSIIGHELELRGGLLEWFLLQDGECRGFTKAIFSGLPTIVLADLVRDVVIPRRDLCGIYHVAAAPISKFDLLRLVAERYGRTIKLVADERPAPDRSLVARRFQQATGYVAADWPKLIDLMYQDELARRDSLREHDCH